jgi:hypothetical protein
LRIVDVRLGQDVQPLQLRQEKRFMLIVEDMASASARLHALLERLCSQ